MYFDRFDVARAYYTFGADYHSGMLSPEYAVLCRVSRYFRPNPFYYKPKRGVPEDQNCRDILANILRRYRANGRKYWK